MVGQPDRALSTRRDEALARLAVTTEALRGLEEALRAEPALPEATAQALVASARALCPVAASTGTELAASAGPDHVWTVFVRSDADGPQLRVRRLRLEAVPVDARPDGARPDGGSTDVAGRLADVLRTGRLDDGALR